MAEPGELAILEMRIPPVDQVRGMCDEDWDLVSEDLYKRLCELNQILYAGVRYRGQHYWQKVINQDAVDYCIAEKWKIYEVYQGTLEDAWVYLTPVPEPDFLQWLKSQFMGISKPEFVALAEKWKSVIEANNWQSEIKELYHETYS